MQVETEIIKKTVEIEKNQSLYGDHKLFNHKPTKEEIQEAVSEIVGELVDSLKEIDKDVFSINKGSFKIVPNKQEGQENYSIGVKLLIEY